VDSILKSPKNIDKVLMLLGFTERDIRRALEFMSFKQQLVKKQNITEEDLKQLEDFKKEIERISQKRKGVLIVSSATSNPRSRRVNLFRDCLALSWQTFFNIKEYR